MKVKINFNKNYNQFECLVLLNDQYVNAGEYFDRDQLQSVLTDLNNDPNYEFVGYTESASIELGL